MSGALTIVGYAVRESLRRRVFTVVLALTVAFLALYAVGAHYAFKDTANFALGVDNAQDTTAFTGATLLGLAMFATLFLGAVVAVFLTLGVVRGDTESGLLQPLVVRPLGRRTLLIARFAGAALISAGYTIAVFLIATAITATHGWSPDHILGPALGLGFGVVIIAALSLMTSVFMSATAQGIAIFMTFGAGLVAGLLGQVGRAIHSGALESIGKTASYALPFEALYQAGLHALTSNTSGLTGLLLSLGPFGGAQAAGPVLAIWAVVYGAAVLTLACLAFDRRDL